MEFFAQDVLKKAMRSSAKVHRSNHDNRGFYIVDLSGVLHLSKNGKVSHGVTGPESFWGSQGEAESFLKDWLKIGQTPDDIRKVIHSAIDRLEAINRLAGLQEAITEVRSFRLAAEAYAPNLATEVIRYRADALVDNLVTRAALLAKQIECGG